MTCDGCAYWRSLYNSSESIKCCHYCVDEGRLRGCPPEACARYRPAKPGKKRWLKSKFRKDDKGKG